MAINSIEPSSAGQGPSHAKHLRLDDRHPDALTVTSFGPIAFEARVQDGDAWATQIQIAAMLGVSVKTVSEHVQGILADGECSSEATIRSLRIVQMEGNRAVSRDVNHYNTDMVAHIGYRVRSDLGVRYRQWVTDVLQGRVQPPAPSALPPSPSLPVNDDPVIAQLAMIQQQAGATITLRRQALAIEATQREQASKLAEHTAALAATREVVDETVARLDAALDNRPTGTLAPNVTPRSWANHVVRWCVMTTGKDYRSVWADVYGRVDVDHRTSVTALTRQYNAQHSSKKSKIEVMEILGYMGAVYDAAIKVCGCPSDAPHLNRDAQARAGRKPSHLRIVRDPVDEMSGDELDLLLAQARESPARED